ncbi:acetyltransferase [Flavobacterium sp. LB1P71]|uniref:acetyltransferase n=1 Tax=unclassified Flavobacterium TaxID=196869 RepID=UPI003AB0B2AE
MYLYGASGHCKVVIEILSESKEYSIEGIYDDNPKLDFLYTIPVINSKRIKNLENIELIITIGDNITRKSIVNNTRGNYKTAVHPKAILSKHSIIGVGTVVMAGAIINPDVVIGKHCIINTGSIIEHDCILEDFVHISPRASLAGNVYIGEGTQIGIGASLIQGVKIGKWVTIGAGSVIINDIPDYAVVVGCPGRIIKYNSENE